MGASFDIIVVGAGIAGLAASISLVRAGHRVKILEAAPQLTEIGAGIQVPPNSVKLLSRLGVYDEVARLATWPRKITIKRWQNGVEIGSTPLLPKMEETYGFPYFLIHRGDLHKVLLLKAQEVGVDIRTGSYVSTVDEDAPSVTLADGSVHVSDLIIGGDGIKSRVRKAVLSGGDVEIRPDPNCAYRTLIPGELMLQDPILKPLMESPTATCWIGHEGHVMAYPIRNGTLFNFVMCHPGSVPVGKPNENAPLDEMRARYKDWDPVITRLINIVPQCLKWQNAELEKFDQWVSKSGKVVLIGDACHGMVPYMAQGAAMAIEDGITLNECLARAKSTKDVPGLLQHYVNLRRDRCYIILDAARNNGNIWHLPDGPEQERRDKGMREGPKEEAVQDSKKENPNKWSDPSFQPWMFGYDAYAETNKYLDKHWSARETNGVEVDQKTGFLGRAEEVEVAAL